MLLTFPSPGCRWGPPRSCSCTSWRAPSRPSSQAGHQRDQTHQTATSGSAGLRGWLGNTIGARGACRGSLQLLWGAATLYRPRSSSKTHFKIVDSSRLNASRVVVLLRGRWLHWAPGGRSRRRRSAGAPAAAAVFDPGRVRASGHPAHTRAPGTRRPPAPVPAGAHQLSHPTLVRGNGSDPGSPENWHQLEKLKPLHLSRRLKFYICIL